MTLSKRNGSGTVEEVCTYDELCASARRGKERRGNMLKLIGILLIVSATTKIGFALAARLERRKNSLLCFKDALSLLESEIGFAQNSLARACENIGNTLSPPAGAFFLDVHDALSRGIDTQQAWEELLGKYRQTLCLTAADIQLLCSFAARLGDRT